MSGAASPLIPSRKTAGVEGYERAWPFNIDSIRASDAAQGRFEQIANVRLVFHDAFTIM